LPAAVDAAGENFAVGFDGEADFAPRHEAAAFLHEFGEQVRDYGRGEARGVGVDEEEDGFIGEQLAALGDEFPQVILEFPHLAAGATAVSGRVHNDGVVAFAAADFAAHKLEAVVGDVADTGVGQATEVGVFAAPFDHTFGGIDVANLGPRLRRRTGRTAGVAEEVEHVDFATVLHRRLDALGTPLPVDGLLREESGVFEGGGRNPKFEPEGFVVEVPRVGHLGAIFPAAAALIAAVIEAVPLLPFGAGAAGPDDLRVGAHEGVRTPAFQFHTVARVEEAVVLPIGRDGHVGGGLNVVHCWSGN
jgi:hypothetical protein